MRRMKAFLTVFWALGFVALTVAPGCAQSNLENLFDFGASIESLAQAARSETPLPVGRYVLLTGVLRSAEPSEDGPYSVRVELAAGQWLGTSRVVLRTVAMTFSGESYRGNFDKESPSFIRIGSRVLAIARIAGVKAGADGSREVILDGAFLRDLEN